MITPKKNYLLTPGPTPLPHEVLEAQARPLLHHRTEEFRSILSEVAEGLKYIFQTKNPVLILTASGTGAMEAAVVNLLATNKKALAVVAGKFGERWFLLCKAYKIATEVLELEWGYAPEPDNIKDILKKDPDIKVVLTTLCETSTGVLSDIKSIAEVCKDCDVLLVVDAISGLGADELRSDAWGVDVVVAGSQKGLMIPPGLSFISLSEKAIQYIAEGDLPKFYFDLGSALKSYKDNDTPFTPAISLIYALKEALSLIKSEGIENIWRRHAKLAEATRSAIRELGLKLFAQSPANAVTSIVSPQGINSGELVKFIRKNFGINFAAGQAKLKDKIFRIAHLGYINSFDLIVGLSALEIALDYFGYSFQDGVSLKAFINNYFKTSEAVGR